MSLLRRFGLVDVLVGPAVVIAVFFLAPLQGHPVLGASMSAVSIAAIAPLVVRHVRRLQVSDTPVKDAVQAIALVATVLVIGFATLYFVLGVHTEGQMDGVATRVDALYFTVTTMVTVGFGDITPIGQAARLLVTVNMVLNVVAVGVVVKVVGWAARRRIGETGIDLGGGDAA